MNIYDVITQRRRALKDLFDSANNFMEPTDREKMLLQHKNDLEKMALKQKNDLDMFKLQTTTEFAQDLFKNKIEFDEDMVKLGIDVWKDRNLADLKFNRDLELERLRQKDNENTTAASLRNQKQLIDEAEDKQLAQNYKQYISEQSLRARKLTDAETADYNVAYGDANYDPYDGGFFSLGVGRAALNTLYSAGSMAATGAGAAFVAGQVGPQIGLPEEVITVPTAALAGGGIGTIHALSEMFGGEGYKKNLGIGVEHFGWTAKGSGDFSRRSASEEAKLDSVIEKIWGYESYEAEKLRTLSRTHDFDHESVFEMAVGKTTPITDPNTGEVIGTGFTASEVGKEIDIQMAQDKYYMYPDVEFSTDKQGVQVVVKTGISLPYGKAANDANGVLWNNYDAISKRLDSVLSEENILLVSAYANQEKANQMQAQRDKLLKYKSDYEMYFADGFKEATEKGGMYSFSKVTAIINTDVIQ